jgi:hypothetical protein
MSTRGAVGFVANKKWYVTYNHSDSYPEYLGMHVLNFCKAVTNWEYLKTLVEKVTLVDEDIKPTQDLIDKYSIYSDTNVGNQSLEDWYCLLRCLQGEKILYEVALGNVEHMIDDHMFLADSLYCEWAYIIDLDDFTLKVYKGGNNKAFSDTPLPSDIISTEYDEEVYKNIKEKYYPVKMLYAYDLSKLPEFMLGVTNEFKKEYRERHKAIGVTPSWENFY